MPDIVKLSEHYKLPKAAPFPVATKEFAENYMTTDLARSGLVVEDMLSRVYPMNGEGVICSYIMPYFNIDGSLMLDSNGVPLMFRCRQLLGETADPKKVGKYTQPGKSAIGDKCNQPYLHPGIWDMPGDTTLICEGEKKTVSCVKYLNYPAIGIGGMGNWRAGKGSNEVNPIILASLTKLETKNIVIVPDGDIMRYDIAQQFGTLATALSRAGYSVLIVELPTATDKIDDLIVEWGPKDALVRFHALNTRVNFLESPASLITQYRLVTRNNRAVQNEANYLKLMKDHPAFQHVWLNTDKNCLMNEEEVFEESVHDLGVLCHMQDNLGFVTAAAAQVFRALYGAARARQRSPFMERISSVQWDGVARLETMFIDYCGSPDTPLVREVGSKWLVASVRRLKEPGSIMDYIVVTLGAQGIGKSSLPGILWGKDNIAHILGHADTKDTLLQIHSNLCINMEEFDTMRRKDKAELKGTITTRSDTFRAPYARAPVNKRRRSVLYASTNDPNFLPEDSTGLRRFAVVPIVGMIKFSRLEADVGQLWAEALYKYEMGDVEGVGNITEASADSQQYVVHNEHYEVLMNVLESNAGATLDGYVYLTFPELCSLAACPSIRDWRADNLKEYLRANGWEYKRGWKRVDGEQLRRVWIYKI